MSLAVSDPIGHHAESLCVPSHCAASNTAEHRASLLASLTRTHLVHIDTVRLFRNLRLVATVLAFVDEFLLLWDLFGVEQVVCMWTELQNQRPSFLRRIHSKLPVQRTLFAMMLIFQMYGHRRSSLRRSSRRRLPCIVDREAAPLGCSVPDFRGVRIRPLLSSERQAVHHAEPSLHHHPVTGWASSSGNRRLMVSWPLVGMHRRACES